MMTSPKNASSFTQFTPLPANDNAIEKHKMDQKAMDFTRTKALSRPHPSRTLTTQQEKAKGETKIQIRDPIDPAAQIPGRKTPDSREREKLDELSHLNQLIQNSIGLVEEQCIGIAKESEKQIIRDFKEKLTDAEREIEELKKKEPEFNAAYWMQKYKQSTKVLELMRLEAIRLDRLNDMMEKELKMVRTELQQSQAESESLARKLFGSEKEITYLTEQLAATQQQLQISQQSEPQPFERGSMVFSDSKTDVYSSRTLSPSSSSSTSLFGINEVHVPALRMPTRKVESPRASMRESSRDLVQKRSVSTFYMSKKDLAPGPSSMRASRSQTAGSVSSRRSGVVLPRLSNKDDFGVRKTAFREMANLRSTNSESFDPTFIASMDKDTAINTVVHLQQHIQRLKQLLEQEKKNTRNVRTAHLKTLAERTELQDYLNECIRDVQKELTKTQIVEFSSADARRRTMELLFSRSKVLDLLHSKTFPDISKLTSGIVNISGKKEEDLFKELFEKERAEVLASMRQQSQNVTDENMKESQDDVQLITGG
ncbi:uncharacterized protein MONOS_2104 [Monocercomonoides exilis]|uniref:uncharacterized protein n=1 Tax=Monocercomonoides exilis TaxID=2049356 RepID=UPI00355A713B|nr:hypothetical protein MONOS_2104 [Monocercomonoides exilis]